MAVAVRRAVAADLPFVGQDGYLPGPALRQKVARGDVVVAERDGACVGYLRLEWLWSRLPYVELIRVLPGHRRGGVGRALLAHVAAALAADGHGALYSSSQADEPEPQAWHRHVGFEECGFLAGVNDGGVGEVFFRMPIRQAPA